MIEQLSSHYARRVRLSTAAILAAILLTFSAVVSLLVSDGQIDLSEAHVQGPEYSREPADNSIAR